MRAKQKPIGFWGWARRYWRHTWRTLVAGLLVWIPLIITIWVSWFFINMFVLSIERLIHNGVLALNQWGARHPLLSPLQHLRYVHGSGILIVAALFLGTGVLTRHLIGRRIIAIGERVVHVIPFVNRIYRAVQQIRDVFINRDGGVFQKVCLIEYPREGMLAIAFVTSSDGGVVQEVAGKPLTAVFVPTTPNPTSGYLVYLRPEEIVMLDMSVEEAMKLIVSGGAYIPPRSGASVDDVAAEAIQPETEATDVNIP